jgi:hypothetical protein
MNGTARWLVAIAVVGAALPLARAAEEEMASRRRALRQGAPEGYLAVVSLASQSDGALQASLVCEAEGVELRVREGRWEAVVEGEVRQQGALDVSAPAGFFVKRTPGTLLVGANGRWLYSGDAEGPVGKAAVRVVAPASVTVTSMRIVPREPVQFADDFPDPVPRTGVWAPVRGHWALNSLSYPDQSANPAELAAIFDPLGDEASRGRTRETHVGIGVRLGQGRHPTVAHVAAASPAERAGIRQGDQLTEVDGYRLRSAEEATALLVGQVGTPVRVAYLRGEEEREAELTRELIIWGKTHRQMPIEPVTEGDAALITAGYDFWTDHRFACSASTHGIGAFGLVFAYLGPSDYHVFRWLGAEKVASGCGRWQLERVRGGRSTVLAARDGGFFPEDFYAISVSLGGDRAGRVKATCAVDSRPVLEAFDDAIVPGRVGLWAEAPGAVCFDDVVVGAADDDRLGSGSKSLRQRRDRLMRYWADPRFAWQMGREGLWWRTENYPGDVTATAPRIGAPTRLVLGAAERDAATGYSFELSEDGSRGVLRRAGVRVAEQALPAQSPKEFSVAREGRHVRVRLDGARWLDYEDPEPLAGSQVGVGGDFVTQVEVDSPNAADYYFNGSPSEWHVMHGAWEVMNRWVCDPRWSFFGGRSDEAVAAWAKRRQEGECYLDVHVGVMMMALGGRYENMRDVGLTLCGDGRNLASGYAAIVGAAGNRMTVLCRNGTVVARTYRSAALLPSRSGFGRGGELRSQHRGWFHIKLAKERGTVRLFVWDREVLAYEDPEPLPGGHAAIWSVDNGLLLGKVRLAASRLGPPEPFLREWRPFADRVLTNDCEGGQVRIERRDGVYQVTNAVGGGRFATALRPRVFSARERPRLSFDVKLQPGAKVDLYLRCHGTLYRVLLTGPPTGPCPARTLTRAEGVQADGQWHTVSVDLLQALRERHPDDPLLMVWEPMVANLANEHYLLAGFTGNRAGATYWLRNVRLDVTPGAQVAQPTSRSF